MPDSFVKHNESNTVAVTLKSDQLALRDSGGLNELIQSELGKGLTNFEFDLSEIGTLNSAGIGVLIACRKSILDKGGSLRLVNVNNKIIDIFRLTKLEGIFGLEN